MIKKITIVFALLLCMMGLANNLIAQNIHPSVQSKIDSLQSWINTQITQMGSIDQTELNNWNEKIRMEQERIANEEKSTNTKKTESGFRNLQFSGYSGSSFSVPKGKKWKVKRLTCSSGVGEYSVVITSLNLKQEYNEGETIYTPSYASETSLITNDASGVIYMYEIIEFDTN